MLGRNAARDTPARLLERHLDERGAALALALVASSALGCPSPNTFATPRTVPAGEVAQTFAVEVLGAAGEPASRATPLPPVYQLRVGLAERADLGVRVAHLSSLGADVKLLLVKGVVDLAVAPGLSGGAVIGRDGGLVAFASAPLLVGWNVTNTTTLLATGGFFMPIALTKDAPIADALGRMRSTYPGARFGLGLNLHPTESFSFQPEITAIYGRPGGQDLLVIMPGVGITFGAQPRYDDVE